MSYAVGMIQYEQFASLVLIAATVRHKPRCMNNAVLQWEGFNIKDVTSLLKVCCSKNGHESFCHNDSA